MHKRLKGMFQPVAKAATWRLIGTVDAIVLTYFVTGKLDAAVTVAGIGTVTHTVLYVLHEKAWSHSVMVRLFGNQGSH